jgi:DUF1680 family protein
MSVSRRKFIQSTSIAAAAVIASRKGFATSTPAIPPLDEFDYSDVSLHSDLHNQQLEQTREVLMALSDDSLLKPIRAMIGREAPGEELGGWYKYDPNFDWHTFDVGFAPACTFGQWVSALARNYAITKDAKLRERVLRLNQLYAQEIDSQFYVNNRFPAYCYDKLVLGLIDSHRYVNDSDAYRILERTTETALPHMPGKAIEQGIDWRGKKDESYTWDESYTISENLFLAYQRGAGDRYKKLAMQYLHDEYFDPLAEGRNSLAEHHAYSHVNALCSAMQAWMVGGSEKHLRAAKNGFDILQKQSFVTGGWGPDERLRPSDSDQVNASLTNTHHSFETPCGAYAHFKLTRYLTRVTRDVRYGDSMERMMYNTILGALPMHTDGRTFYYSDYNFKGKKVYSDHRWPCCSGTHPQVAADYRINTYFRDPRGVFVTLYIPSTVTWQHEGSQISLKQSGEYPFDNHVEFEITASRPARFNLNLRIPGWAHAASISVNGKRIMQMAPQGTYAAIEREWKTGDRVELELPLRKHLEPIDSRHPKTVALVSGPLVLFAVAENAPSITSHQLMGAKKVGAKKWQVETATAPLTLLPFTEIGEEQYSTYVNLT